MSNDFGMYLILLRQNEIDEKSILDFLEKIIDSENNKDTFGNKKSKPHVKGVIFDMLNILRNNKKQAFNVLIEEIKKRKLDLLIDPYTNKLYDSIRKTWNFEKNRSSLLSKLIKDKFLQDKIQDEFTKLLKGGRNKGIKLSLELDNYFLSTFLRFQKENNITSYVIPYVPLDPSTFRVSLLKNQYTIKNAQAYLERVLFVKDPEIVPVICVTKNMLDFVYGHLDKDGKKIIRRIEWSQLLESYHNINPKKLIIKIDNFSQYERDTSDFESIRYFFVEVNRIFSNADIIFSDFNEFAYKLSIDGLENYGTTICKDLARKGGGKPPTDEQKLGKYYIEKDMEYYFINQIGDKLDNCFFCKLLQGKRLDKDIDKKLWEYCRLGHFINAKNNEANKINKSKNKGQLDIAIHDMFAESKNLKSLAKH